MNSSLLKWRPRRRAFTLIEIMIVVVIIGLLAGLVGPKLVKKLVQGQKGAAKAQVHLFGNALKDYFMDMGEYPDSIKALLENPGGDKKWDGPYLDPARIPDDPWGEPYEYSLGEKKQSFKLSSKGPDKTAGTEDDITN